MKSKKNIIVIICLCLAVVAVLVCINQCTRVSIPDNQIRIEGQRSENIDLSGIVTSNITGQIVNSNEQTKKVSGVGIGLGELIKDYAPNDYTEVTVISDDEYSASLTRAEVDDADNVVLLIEAASARLYVFSDSNSKRNVSNVKRIIIK